MNIKLLCLVSSVVMLGYCADDAPPIDRELSELRGAVDDAAFHTARLAALLGRKIYAKFLDVHEINKRDKFISKVINDSLDAAWDIAQQNVRKKEERDQAIDTAITGLIDIAWKTVQENAKQKRKAEKKERKAYEQGLLQARNELIDEVAIELLQQFMPAVHQKATREMLVNKFVDNLFKIGKQAACAASKSADSEVKQVPVVAAGAVKPKRKKKKKPKAAPATASSADSDHEFLDTAVAANLAHKGAIISAMTTAEQTPLEQQINDVRLPTMFAALYLLLDAKDVFTQDEWGSWQAILSPFLRPLFYQLAMRRMELVKARDINTLLHGCSLEEFVKKMKPADYTEFEKQFKNLVRQVRQRGINTTNVNAFLKNTVAVSFGVIEKVTLELHKQIVVGKV